MLARFSDFAEEKPMTGAKISVNEIIGKEITVKGFRVADSSKRSGTKCLTLHIDLDGEERVVFTGSSVLLEQSEKYKDHLPFLATIKRVDSFLTFS